MSEVSISFRPSRKNVTAFERAEDNARRTIDAAVTVDGVERFPPFSYTMPSLSERWWLTVFGATEDELREQQQQLARRYRRLRLKLHGRHKRKQIKAAYIRVDAMLRVGRGLETDWR